MKIRNSLLKYGTAVVSVVAPVSAFAVTDFDAISTAGLAQLDAGITVGLAVAAVGIAFLIGYKMVKRVAKGF